MSLTDPDVLIVAAAQAGFRRGEAAAALAREEWGKRVRTDQRAAAAMNNHAVPTLLVQDRFPIPGAQPLDGYVTALRRVAGRVSL